MVSFSAEIELEIKTIDISIEAYLNDIQELILHGFFNILLNYVPYLVFKLFVVFSFLYGKNKSSKSLADCINECGHAVSPMIIGILK